MCQATLTMSRIVKRAYGKCRSNGPREFLKTFYKYTKRKLKRNQAALRVKSLVEQRIQGHRAVADPFKIVQVSPDEIQRYTSKFGKWESVGLIADGEWDKKASPVTDMKKYNAVEQHFYNGISWEDTGIIDYLYNRIAEQERELDGCRTRDDVVERYKHIDNVYEDIRKNGYNETKHSSHNYVAVHIGRDGELIFAGSGYHRLAICKIANIKKIPVWIRGRHEQWQQIRDSVAALQSCPDRFESHPDLKDVKL